MQKGKLQIHSENLLPIIKRWLYSDRDIFLRELVSNACDALSKLKILRDRGECEFSDDSMRIDVKIDKEAKTITVIDTGIGMSAEEVEKYIANLAFSGAEEFVKKYESKTSDDQIIGHFGLGFYSAYMVANLVEIDTVSYREGSQAVHWTSDGSTDYEIEDGKRDGRGTEITLHVNEDNTEFLDAAKIRSMLTHYCSYLPFPIYLNDARINDHEPLWVKAPSECKDEDYLAFFRHLYPMEQDPLFWIHLNVDYPFHLKGILYFPKLRRDFDPSHSNIQLYYNRVFVTDNCKDIIPDYLMMLKGTIDSPDIPLNVSRSSLQMDRTVRQLSTHISKKVSDRLSTFYKSDREKFLNCYKDIEVIIKLGVIQDDKFYDRMKECLVWKTLDNEWITAEQYLETYKDKAPSKLYYTNSIEENSAFLQLYKDQKIAVLQATGPVDVHLMSFLEGKLAPAKFQRVDAAVDELLIDKSKENTLLDADGKTVGGKLGEAIASLLKMDNLSVEAKSLASATLPGFLVIDENMRRLRDYMRLTQSTESMDLGPQKMVFVVNSNNALIKKVYAMSNNNRSLAEKLMRHLFDLAKLNQKEMTPKETHTFTQDSAALIEELASRSVEVSL